MALQSTYPTEQAAADAMRAEGFRQCADPAYWAIRGRPDPFYGSAERTYLAEIRRYNVAPEYGGGAYFAIWFL